MTRDSFLQFLFGGKTSINKSAPISSKRKTLSVETLEDRHMLSVSFESPLVSSYAPDPAGVTVNPSLVDHRLLFSGDFNNDGKPDILTIQGGNAYTYLNSGSATNAFPAAPELAVSGLYTTMQAGVGKVTGGSHLDLLTGIMLNNVLTISVYGGRGNGGFYSASTDSTWSGIQSFLQTQQGVEIPNGASLYATLGDKAGIVLVENSGRVDLICTIVYQVLRADHTVHTSGEIVLQFTNNGNGGFTSQPTVLKAGSTTIPSAVLAAGDLSGDAKTDYVAVNKENNRTLDIYLNDGTKISTNDFGKDIGEVVVANCHSSANKMEIIVALSDASNNHYLCVITVTGTSLSYSEHFQVDIVPTNITTGNFDNDPNGRIDIFISDGSMHQTLLGQADGKFAKQNVVVTNADFMAVYSADFNGDGNIDTLAVGKRFAWLIPGDTTKSPTSVLDFASLGITPMDVAFGDFNGDGKMDFAVLSHLGSDVYVFTNESTPAASKFTRTSTLPVSLGKQLLVANFDNVYGDDIVVYGYDSSGAGAASPSLQTYLSTSSGGFGAVKITNNLPTMQGTTKPYDLLAVGEVTNDGYVDIVGIWNGTVGLTTARNSYYHVLPNSSTNPGSFSVTGTQVSLGSLITTCPTAVAIGDMTGDGRNDLVLLDADSKSVWIIPQHATTSGTFPTNNIKTFLVTGNNVEIAAFSHLALADFHGAGTLDVLVGMVTTSGTQFRVMENDPANKGTLKTDTNFTTVGSFDGANAGSLAIHVGLLDGNATADVVIVGGNTVKRFINTDKTGSEVGTVTLVFRDYNSTLVSTEIVDLNTLSDRLAYIDEWSNFWVEIWANTGTSVGISSFTTSLTFNADIFEVRSGKIEYSASVSQSSTPKIETGVITLSGTVSGLRGANANNTLLARVSFMPVAGGATTPGQTETKGILLNYSTNTAYVQPIANGFALDATKSSLTTTSNATGQPAPALLGTVPLFPVIYDINDDGVVDPRDFTQFVRALIAGGVSASSAPLFARLCDYNLDGVIDPRDFTWFAMNLADGLSREACRANPSLKVAYPSAFTQVPLTSAIAPATQTALLAELTDDVIAPLAGTLAPAMQQQSLSDQSTQNQALMAFIASQETKNDDFDLDIPNQAFDTERLLAEGKL